MNVYLLWHVHVLPTGDDNEKLIGVYSTRENAEAALERTRPLPGFRDSPDGFVIDKYPLDEDNWTEGYYTVTWTEDEYE